MIRINWRAVAACCAGTLILAGSLFSIYLLGIPDIPEGERLAALARIAANVIKSTAPQARNAPIKLVQALPHENVVEAEFQVDAVTAQLFRSSRLRDLQASIISSMCQSNLSSGFRRGLIIHSIYTSARGDTLADFNVDKRACSGWWANPMVDQNVSQIN